MSAGRTIAIRAARSSPELERAACVVESAVTGRVLERDAPGRRWRVVVEVAQGTLEDFAGCRCTEGPADRYLRARAGGAHAAIGLIVVPGSRDRINRRDERAHPL